MICFCLSIPVVLFVQLSRNTLYLLSHCLCFVVALNRDSLFVNRDESLKSKRVMMQTEQSIKYFEPFQKLRAWLGP